MSVKKRWKAIIVDDEPDAIEVLGDMILSHCPEVDLLGTATSSKLGLALIEKLRPEILFLDIQMPGASGFELLQSLYNHKPYTIFVSAHETYAIEAVKFQAIAYLLKPVGASELKEAIEIVKKQSLEAQQVNYKKLLERLPLKAEKSIAIPTGSGFRYLKPKEIIRIEAAKNYSNVFTTESARPILVSKNLKQFEIILAKYGFIRIHNAHLVNPHHVKEYLRKEGGAVILSDGMKIFLGPNYRQLVIEVLKNNSDSF